MKISIQLSAIETMYPTQASVVKLHKEGLNCSTGSAFYGYVISGAIKMGGMSVCAGHVFATSERIDCNEDNTTVWLVTRHGFNIQTYATRPEHKGRLTYIDGCSDSLLIYPPRKGDGSLSLLYFPVGIDQRWHSHPSIRMGYVASGSGLAEWRDSKGNLCKKALKAGQAFYLPEQTQHRFCTTKNELRILAYHPDGDWGPEDHNHTMLNRTYLRT